jgi:RNA recognition motif-containing protein
MAAWVFVDGFPDCLPRKQLATVFSRFGTVRAVHLIRPVRPDYCPVAFIDMTTTAGAGQAVKALHGSIVKGHRLRVVIIGPGKPFHRLRLSR